MRIFYLLHRYGPPLSPRAPRASSNDVTTTDNSPFDQRPLPEGFLFFDPSGESCAQCFRQGGLCTTHAEWVGQVGRPHWVTMIGDLYVCQNPSCEEHALCLDTRAVAPQAGCACHNCTQKRWAKKLEAKRAAELETSVAALRAQRRNERREKKAEARAEARKLSRLSTAMAGGFIKNRPRAA